MSLVQFPKLEDIDVFHSAGWQKKQKRNLKAWIKIGKKSFNPVVSVMVFLIA